jgi:hypothetical protein
MSDILWDCSGSAQRCFEAATVVWEAIGVADVQQL